MHKPFRLSFLLWLAAALLLSACSSGTLKAPPIREPQASLLTVTSEGDDGGDGTLRSLIEGASSGDLITFADSVSTITLSTELVINNDLTIEGPEGSSVTISGNNRTRVFVMDSGTTVELSNLTITGGFVTGTSGLGGGILNNGTLTITNSTVSGNVTSGGGGGIYNVGGLNVRNSTLSGNSAASGGGILNNGTLTLLNSTVSGNSASNTGGGILNNGPLIVADSTVSGNSAASGGGIYNRDTFALINSIVALNTDSSGESDIYGNIIGGNSNIVGGNPGLELNSEGQPNLTDNGGPTQTIALLAGSPALDKAASANCPPTDQRGVERPQGNGCDIGAFELEVEQ